MPPWLSVLMPTCNGARYLAAALDSVVAQDEPGLEVLVADDGSTDGTLEIVRRYQKLLPIRVVQEEKKSNWVAGTNVALRAAAGDYACVLHQDDLWLPGRAAAIRSARPFRLLVHPAVFIAADGRRLGAWRTPLAEGSVGSAQFLEHLLVQNFLAMPAPVFFREAALPLGLDEDLWYTADWDLWLRLGAGGPVRSIAQPLAAFRLHAASQTMARERGDLRRQLQVVLARHFDAWAAAVPAAVAGRVREVAGFSVEVNLALAAAQRGSPGAALALAPRFLRLGPAGWARFLRDSRLRERIWSRLRA